MIRPGETGPVHIPEDLRATLVLVRHGESTYVAEGRFQGRQDPPLSARGEQQAASVAAWLAAGGPPGLVVDTPPRELVHSPLTRAARTAERIAAALATRFETGAPIVRVEPRFTEISQGAWEGLTHAEVASRWADRLEAWRRTPTTASAPGGETLQEADRRVREAIPALLGPLRAPAMDGVEPRAGDPWSIVVAHDGILRVLLLAILDLPLERFWAFPFALCGVTVVELADGRGALRAHNLSPAVADPREPGVAGASLPDRGGAL